AVGLYGVLVSRTDSARYPISALPTLWQLCPSRAQPLCCRSHRTRLPAWSATFVPAAGGVTTRDVEVGEGEPSPPPPLNATAATRPATAAATSAAIAPTRPPAHRDRGPPRPP